MRLCTHVRGFSRGDSKKGDCRPATRSRTVPQEAASHYVPGGVRAQCHQCRRVTCFVCAGCRGHRRVPGGNALLAGEACHSGALGGEHLFRRLMDCLHLDFEIPFCFTPAIHCVVNLTAWSGMYQSLFRFMCCNTSCVFGLR